MPDKKAVTEVLVAYASLTLLSIGGQEACLASRLTSCATSCACSAGQVISQAAASVQQQGARDKLCRCDCRVCHLCLTITFRPKPDKAKIMTGSAHVIFALSSTACLAACVL